jgi:diaminohydroxyphosphoribosylaminopyrimidine deaminase/5-amino-6-(5-phosphoribosylamino)uracil reductase
VGEGWHERAGEPHAEIHALRAAGAQSRGATVYQTLEPCCHYGRTPPCSAALIEAGVARVVAAMGDPNPRVAGQGFAALAERGIAVQYGLMQAEAETLNPGFIRRMAQGRPYVRIKLAASLDGRTALANGTSRWITGEAARLDVQRLRARSSAIVTGIETVLADDPALTVRQFDTNRQPLRVVLDSGLRCPPTAKLLRAPGRALIVGTRHAEQRAPALRAGGTEVVTLSDAAGRVDLTELLELLATREVNEVLVEAGPRLSGALLQARLVDELVLYYAAHLLGTDARGMFGIEPLTAMEQRIGLAIVEVRRIGPDLRIVAKPCT